MDLYGLKQLIREEVTKQLSQHTLQIGNYFDLSKFSDEQWKFLKMDLRLYAFDNGFDSKVLLNNDDSLIGEEATRTLFPKDVYKVLKKELHFPRGNFVTDYGANHVQIIVLFADLFMNEALLNKTMESCGWYKSKESSPVPLNGTVIKAISFGPMFQNEVTDKIKKDGFLYHVSPKRNEESILKNGLLPKSENSKFDYPPKIHLVKGYKASDNVLFSLCWNLYTASSEDKRDNVYAVYKINLKSLPRETKFYYDPRFEDGVCTYDKIPASCISKVKEFNLN